MSMLLYSLMMFYCVLSCFIVFVNFWLFVYSFGLTILGFSKSSNVSWVFGETLQQIKMLGQKSWQHWKFDA